MESTSRIATFNLRHGRGLDDVIDLERTAAAIEATGAELVALQELDRHQERSGGVDQPKVLEELTGLSVSFWPTVSSGSGKEYGLGFASTKSLGSRFEPLPRLGGEEPRGVVVVSWRGFQVFTTHLSTHPKARAVQTSVLAEMAGAARSPAIVIGDLNQGRRSLRALEQRGFHAGRRAVPSLAAGSPRRQIDFVLGGPGVVLLRTWSIETDASDHRPLVAEIGPIA